MKEEIWKYFVTYVIEFTWGEYIMQISRNKITHSESNLCFTGKFFNSFQENDEDNGLLTFDSFVICSNM